MKALIVFGTRYGATRSTSELIAEVLQECGFETKVVEAKKEKINDDFSIWIEENFDEPALVKKIRDIDFYFFSLNENRQKVIRFIKERLNQ